MYSWLQSNAPPFYVILKVGQNCEDILNASVDHDIQFEPCHLTHLLLA